MKKILFNDKYGLTKAVLDGRKTQARQAIIVDDFLWFYKLSTDKNGQTCAIFVADDGWGGWFNRVYPDYQIGEAAAVAQSYRDIYEMVNGNVPEDHRFSAWLMKDMFGSKGWKNKMFVRPGCMSSFVEITNIRVERLQDISDEDCLKEGVKETNLGFTYEQPWTTPEQLLIFDSPKLAFASLINKDSGEGTWNRNTWVFVYDFKLVKK